MRIHHATTEAKVEVDFDCGACGFAGTAVVSSEGIGTATSFIVLDREDARGAASEESAAEAVHQAKVTAALLPCPRCRRRSRAVVAQFVVLTVLGVAILLALAAAAWWLDAGLRSWVVTGALVVVAAQIARRKRRQFLEAEARVERLQVRAVLPRAVAVQLGAARIAPATPAEPAADDEPPADGGPRLLR